MTECGETDVPQIYCLSIYHCILKMESVNFLAQNNGEDNFDSSVNQHSPTTESTTDCEPLSPDSLEPEEEDIYLTASEDENNPSDPRLELIDRQFNLKMKELFSQASSGQLVPHTVEATLQQTAQDMLQYLGKSHPLTWISHVKTSQEEDELLLWMTVMKDNVDVLVTQFQQQMFTGFSKMMSEW